MLHHSDFASTERLTLYSMTIRTACSSALTGLAEAFAAIQRGICEGAIVAGSNLILAPGMTQQMTEKGILSPNGSCKTFSADADGYARGEAFTAVFVKPLDAAIRDGNPIRAVIRAAVANSDGKTQGITQPNGYAHEAMIRLAYKQAGIKVSKYLEVTVLARTSWALVLFCFGQGYNTTERA